MIESNNKIKSAKTLVSESYNKAGNIMGVKTGIGTRL